MVLKSPSHLSLLVSVLFALLFWKCDENRLAPIDTVVSVPSVRLINVWPDSIYLDSLNSSNGNYTVTSTISAYVVDPDGGGWIAGVVATVFKPNSASPLTQVTLKDDGALADSLAGDGWFSARLQFGISRTQTGRYRIQIKATDRNGIESNIKEGSLVLWRTNSRPYFSALPSVQQFSPAGSDSVRLAVSIAVSDSDGLSDVYRVVARALNSTDSSAHEMYDDGLMIHRDPFPGDGIFSSIFWTHPLSGVQDLVIEFTAQDKQGAISDPLHRALTNSSPRIVRLDVPDSIQRPTGPPQLIPFRLTAADSNGLGDIDSVFFTNLSSANPANFLMYDDGNLAIHGDSTQGDGIYSTIVSIDASTTLGVKNFQFNVKDKFGAKDSLRKFITIY